MTRKIFQEKKKTLLFLSIIILFALTLGSCNWFGEGILNVFDPQAQIRVNHSNITIDESGGTVDLEIYSINQVEFLGEGFNYKYYADGEIISELSKTVGIAFYVEPSDTPGSPGAITEIKLPLFYNDVMSYLAKKPLDRGLTCTISLIGTDGSGHDIKKAVVVDLPVHYFPEINIILTANPASYEIEGGTSEISAHVVTVPYGKPVQGLNVVFTTTGGILSADSATTGSPGTATVNLTMPNNNREEDRTYKVTATVGDKEASVTITVYGIEKDSSGS
jgi:hypothetical protein